MFHFPTYYFLYSIDLPSDFSGYATQLHGIFLSPLRISFSSVSIFSTLFVPHLQPSFRNEYQVAHPYETKNKTTAVLYILLLGSYKRKPKANHTLTCNVTAINLPLTSS